MFTSTDFDGTLRFLCQDVHGTLVQSDFLGSFGRMEGTHGSQLDTQKDKLDFLQDLAFNASAIAQIPVRIGPKPTVSLTYFVERS
jgi:hypothetical protein